MILHAFKEAAIRDRLIDMARRDASKKNRYINPSQDLFNGLFRLKAYIVKISTAIPASTAGPPITLGSATCTLMKAVDVNGTMELSQYFLPTGETANEKTIYNPTFSAIGAANDILLAIEDAWGILWPAAGLGTGIQVCRFTVASSAFTTSSASFSGTIVRATNASTGTITIQNSPTSSSGVYQYEGDVGDYGKALYWPSQDEWEVFDMECP